MSQPIHTHIQLSGVKLEVIGTYYPGEDASLFSPGEPESVEIEQMLTPKGDDIGEMIASSPLLQYDAEQLTIAAHKEGVLCAAEDHADCVRKGEFK